MNKQLKSNLLILLAAFIWGTAFLAQKEGGQIGTFTFNGIRFLIGGAFLLPVIYVFDRIRERKASAASDIQGSAAGGSDSDAVPDLDSEPDNGKGPDSTGADIESGPDMSWNRTVFTGGICCGVILFVASSLQQYGVLFTSIGKTGFITALYTLFVPVLSIAFGKKVSKLTWTAVFIGLIGLYLISMFGESFSISYGDRFIIACAFGFAFQIMAIDHFAPKVDPVKLSAVEFLTLGIISLFFMFTFEEPTVDKIVSVLPSLLYASILSSGVAYTLQVVGQQHAEPTQAAIMMCMESVFSLLTGMIVLGERMAVHEYIGAALIFAAVVMSQLPDKDRKGGDLK